MPELPEVETVRRGLLPLVTGATIASAGSHPSAKFDQALEAVGTRIIGVERRGKYLLLGLDDERTLVVHLGMTGQLRVDPPGSSPDPYDRAWWTFGDGRELRLRDVRRFGRVAVLGEDHSSLPTLAGLGPEPFDPAFTPEHLWRSLNSRSARIKTQLLSQRPVAGVGNIYADEALWRAKVHPAARHITKPGAKRLRDAIIAVLQEGIDHGGTTLRDYVNVDGGSGQNQFHLECYGRTGEPCNRCSTLLRRQVFDGRSTTWCPKCQRK